MEGMADVLGKEIRGILCLLSAIQFSLCYFVALMREYQFLHLLESDQHQCQS